MERCRFVLNVVLYGLVLTGLASAPAAAQSTDPVMLSGANCAPEPAAPLPAPGTASPSVTAPRIVGGQSSEARHLFGTGDLLVVGAGTGSGISLGQQFFVKRQMAGDRNVIGQPRPIGTIGGIRIVSANETTALAVVDFACDGILTDDYLEPYRPMDLPQNADHADTAGELDFSSPGHVVTGPGDHVMGVQGDFMVADVGGSAAPGARFAVYRDIGIAGVPVQAIGEAIVVSTAQTGVVVRLTLTRDAVRVGDLLIPRKR